MGQEYFINSQNLEDKVRQILPSQGGSGSGFDLSASTQIVPIVDLTEQAEGSNVRADLQSAFTFDNVTNNFVTNATTTIITNTGYWRLFGTSMITNSTSSFNSAINITDGSTIKTIFRHQLPAGSATAQMTVVSFDFLVKLEAGDSIEVLTNSLSAFINITHRQIATIDGTLINT